MPSGVYKHKPHSSEHKEKIRLAMKGRMPKHIVGGWNKGLKYSKYGDEKPSTVLRRNPEYYLKELELNAKRSKIKNYYLNENRRKVIDQKSQIYKTITGSGRPPKEWSEAELTYLRETYNHKTTLEIALFLGRSWSSISHKTSRLGLQKYNKWN